MCDHLQGFQNGRAGPPSNFGEYADPQEHRDTEKPYENVGDSFGSFTLECTIAQVLPTYLTPFLVRAIKTLHVQPKGNGTWSTGNFSPCLLQEGPDPQEALNNSLLIEVISKLEVQVLPDLILQ